MQAPDGNLGKGRGEGLKIKDPTEGLHVNKHGFRINVLLPLLQVYSTNPGVAECPVNNLLIYARQPTSCH